MKIPSTPAVRAMKAAKIDFEPYLYKYEEKGGTRQTADELKVDEHSVVKTLVLQTDEGKCLIMLQHGDMEVSLKEMARIINVKKVFPSDAKTAMKLTGFQFGGTSPFGTKTKLPVYAEKTIFNLDKIFINAGKRGFIAGIRKKKKKNCLEITEVEAGIKQ